MDKKEDLLSPNATPSTVPNTSGRRPSVRRLNKIPIYIVIGIISIFTIIIALVAATKGNKLNMSENLKNTSDSTSLAKGILDKAPKDGIIGSNSNASDVLPIPNEESSSSTVTELNNLSNASDLTLDSDAPTSLPPPQEMAAPVDMQQQYKHQMFAEALRANTKVSNSYSSSTNSQTFVNNNQDDLLSQIHQVQEAAQNATAENAQNEAQAVYNQLTNQEPSLSKPPQPNAIRTVNNTAGSGNKWVLNSKIENSKSKSYTLMTGSVIPAIAISGINSDLPGQVMAQVSINVYDSATGKRILIPQGSKLIGSYDSGTALGQNRLFVAWKRIIFPNGHQSIDIGSMPGSNGAGYSGVKDRVNNHYMKIWSNAIMLSAVGASMSFGTNRDKNNIYGNNTTFSSELSSNLAATFGQAVAQSIQKNMNISPTLQIRPGYRFNVIVTQDITFN